MSINREGVPLIYIYKSLKQMSMREKKKFTEEEKNFLLYLGFILSWFGIALGDGIYTKEFVWFSPLWFPEENIFVLFCCCTCLSLSHPIAYGYDEIMLIV